MMEKNTGLYTYRWVILALFMALTLVIEIQWLTHAPIRSAAVIYYHVSGSMIDLLSMSYMLVFLFLCIPASFIIDHFGIRIGLGIGAVLTGIFGLLKGLFAPHFTAVLICQFGLAAAQPFILNAVTAVTVRWFPLKERGMTAGFAALAQYLGIIIVMILTPQLINTVYQDKILVQAEGIDRVLFIYGFITLAVAVLSLLFIRERPPLPPAIESVKRYGLISGIRHILKLRNMILLIILFCMGLGIFNAVSTMIDAICLTKGLNIEQSGLVGGFMLIGGVAGAVILPILSDIFRRRKIFLIICMIGVIPSLAGLTFFSGFFPVLAAAFVLGFFVMSAGPIGFQYAAEVSFPAPESISQGLLLLSGQISGLVFVAGMGTEKGVRLFMVGFIILSVLTFTGSLFLTESPMILTERQKKKN